MSQTILVTGGAGYIGSHTCVELLNAGFEVVVADDLRNSKLEALNRVKRITGKGIRFYDVDVCDTASLRRVFTENHIDGIIHFAGLKAVGESVMIPIEYYRNNLNSTLNLLEAMSEFKVHSLVFSSSATVYINPVSPIIEDAPRGCTNPYGWTKYMSEQIITDWQRVNPNACCLLLRYFNPIGAHESGLIGEDPSGIPNNLLPYIAQVAVGKRERLSVFGNDYPTRDGTGVRDYLHVCDLARGHVNALKYCGVNMGAQAVNLGTGIGYSVLDIVHAFEEASGVKIPYVIAPRRAGDIAECYSNPQNAEELLGWKAELDLKRMCLDSYRWQTMNPEGYGE